jgi:GNAT superfamily N-acetyltransferase
MMGEQENSRLLEPGLLAAWLAARSIARGLALPVPDHGGWRVDTGLPGEIRRHVFSGPVPGISVLAASIEHPHIFIKMCGSGEQLLRLLPDRWQLLPGGFFMTHEGRLQAPALPAGYLLDVTTSQAITTARILTGDGAVVASGHAVEYAGVFVFDRIVTEAGHRRRGLGRALMAALAARQRSGGARRVLVATEDGSKLYASLGWHTQSPYSTATIM